MRIPAGVRAGAKVRIPGEGVRTASGASQGDLYLKVKVRPHPYFTIDGDNLVCEIALSPAQAVVGGEATVNTTDGPVRIRIPASTQSGRMLRLKNKGLPQVKGDKRGDQLVRTKILIPDNLTEKEIALYSELAKLEQEKIST